MNAITTEVAAGPHDDPSLNSSKHKSKIATAIRVSSGRFPEIIGARRTIVAVDHGAFSAFTRVDGGTSFTVTGGRLSQLNFAGTVALAVDFPSARSLSTCARNAAFLY